MPMHAARWHAHAPSQSALRMQNQASTIRRRPRRPVPPEWPVAPAGATPQDKLCIAHASHGMGSNLPKEICTTPPILLLLHGMIQTHPSMG